MSAETPLNEGVATDGNTTPGSVLRERFLRPLNISQADLAKILGISRPRINQILNGRCVITAEIALRLGKAFSTGPEYWLELQMRVHLLRANDRLRDELEKIEPLRLPAPD